MSPPFTPIGCDLATCPWEKTFLVGVIGGSPQVPLFRELGCWCVSRRRQ